MRHLLRLLIAGTVALVIVLILRHLNAAGDQQLVQIDGPPLYAIDFRLTERSGKPLTRADLAGKVWIADFIFTSCAGPCPLMTERLSRVEKALAAEPDVRLVSFTMDPEHDTPEALARYADAHGAPRDRWLFATGTRAELERLSIQGFKLGADSGATPIIHASRFVLVDRAGRIRGYYDGEGEGADAAQRRLVADARALLAEGSK